MDRYALVQNIRKLLAKRHIDDVFYEEVTIGHGARRMDAWAMKKSWANPLVIAYEIKSSRQDFMTDHKMQEYLPYCNEAYVVCPKSACSKDEIPEGFGLIYISDNGESFRTVKKSAYRECNLPEKFLRGLMFSKADSYANSFGWAGKEIARRVGTITDFQDYAENRKKLAEIGHSVAQRISKREREIKYIEEQSQEVRENKRTFKALFKAIGEKYGWTLGYEFERAVESGNVQSMLTLLESATPDEYRKITDSIKQLKSYMDQFLIQQVATDNRRA